MAPLPPESTPRFRVNYSVVGLEHNFQVRSHASPSAFGAVINDFLTQLTDALYQLTITSVDFAADGSNIFLPVSTGIEGNIYSSGAGAPQESPNFYGFVGRSSGGRRWRLDVFGARTLGTNFRLSPGENPDVDAARAVLTDVDLGLVAIDDLPVTVYTYINVGTNAYWQREIRA